MTEDMSHRIEVSSQKCDCFFCYNSSYRTPSYLRFLARHPEYRTSDSPSLLFPKGSARNREG